MVGLQFQALNRRCQGQPWVHQLAGVGMHNAQAQTMGWRLKGFQVSNKFLSLRKAERDAGNGHHGPEFCSGFASQEVLERRVGFCHAESIYQIRKRAHVQTATSLGSSSAGECTAPLLLQKQPAPIVRDPSLAALRPALAWRSRLRYSDAGGFRPSRIGA